MSNHEVPQWARLRQAAKQFRTSFVEILVGLISSDAPTRKMSVFFFLSLIVTVWISLQALTQMKHRAVPNAAVVAAAAHGQEHAGAKPVDDDLEKEGEKKPQMGASMLTVGAFTVDLKPQPSLRKKAAGADLADVTLVLECDATETYDYLSQRLPQLKSQITNVFIDLERDELLTREGKLKLKAKLMDRINAWIPKGKVQNIFFSKLTVG